MDQPVGDPTTQGHAGAENQVGKRSVGAGLQKREAPHFHQIVWQPSNQQVPIVAEAEEAHADADEVSAEMYPRAAPADIRGNASRSRVPALLRGVDG